MIGIINSLVKDEMNIKGMESKDPIDFFKMFDLVIFDEVHLYSSTSNRKIYNVAQMPFMIGLSATPDENDKQLDKVNNWCVGPVLKTSELLVTDVRKHSIVVRFGGISEEKTEENFMKQQANDKIKNDFCKDNAFPLLRIKYNEVDNISMKIRSFIIENLIKKDTRYTPDIEDIENIEDIEDIEDVEDKIKELTIEAQQPCT
jgi:superfamily II DNA or RNA helicase